MADPCEISALDVLATGTFWAWALPLSPVKEVTTSASSCGGRADPRGCSERAGDWSALPGSDRGGDCSALPGNAFPGNDSMAIATASSARAFLGRKCSGRLVETSTPQSS